MLDWILAFVLLLIDSWPWNKQLKFWYQSFLSYQVTIYIILWISQENVNLEGDNTFKNLNELKESLKLFRGPQKVNLFPPWLKVRELNLPLSLEGYSFYLKERCHINLDYGVLLSQGYCQQVLTIISRSCISGIEK